MIRLVIMCAVLSISILGCATEMREPTEFLSSNRNYALIATTTDHDVLTVMSQVLSGSNIDSVNIAGVCDYIFVPLESYKSAYKLLISDRRLKSKRNFRIGE